MSNKQKIRLVACCAILFCFAAQTSEARFGDDFRAISIKRQKELRAKNFDQRMDEYRASLKRSRTSTTTKRPDTVAKPVARKIPMYCRPVTRKVRR